MKSQSSRFEPRDVDSLIASFGAKPAEKTRTALESELSEQKARFERTKISTRDRTRGEGHER